MITPVASFDWTSFPADAHDHGILDPDGTYGFPLPAVPSITLTVGSLKPSREPATCLAGARLYDALASTIPNHGPAVSPPLSSPQKLRRLTAWRGVTGSVALPAASPNLKLCMRRRYVRHLLCIGARALGLDDATLLDSLRALGATATTEELDNVRNSGWYQADEWGAALDREHDAQVASDAAIRERLETAAALASKRTPTTPEQLGVTIYARTTNMTLLEAGAVRGRTTNEDFTLSYIDRAMPRAVHLGRVNGEDLFACKCLIPPTPGDQVPGLRVALPDEVFALTASETAIARHAPLFGGGGALAALQANRRLSTELVEEFAPGSADYKSAVRQFAKLLTGTLLADILTEEAIVSPAELACRGLRLPPDIAANMLAKACADATQPTTLRHDTSKWREVGKGTKPEAMTLPVDRDTTPKPIPVSGEHTHVKFHLGFWTDLCLRAVAPGPHLVFPGEVYQLESFTERVKDRFVDVFKKAFGTREEVTREEAETVLADAGDTTPKGTGLVERVNALMADVGLKHDRVGSGAERRRVFVRPTAKPKRTMAETVGVPVPGGPATFLPASPSPRPPT